MGDYTFAEHGEDILIHRLLLWASDGYFLDCGAYHPRKMSLTARLRTFGWHGAYIDADPEVAKRFRSDLENYKYISASIGLFEQTIDLHQYDDPVISTTDQKSFEHLSRIEEAGELFTKYRRTIKVDAFPLEKIIKKLEIDDHKINFVNIDLEGVEIAALETFPWHTQAPAVFAIEIHQLDLSDCKNNDVCKKMKEVGYRLQSYVFHTAIFVKEDFDEEMCHRFEAKTL